MADGDDLAEAELRYRLLAETFEEMPQLRANLCPALERVKAEIVRLRAAVPAADAPTPTVIPFDPARFRKSSG
ncbi:MAG: hypothetical protein U0R77_14435 [Mycolicibacterium insubricum]